MRRLGYWSLYNTVADWSANPTTATRSPAYWGQVPPAIGSGRAIYFDGTTANPLDVPSLHDYFVGNHAFGFAGWVNTHSLSDSQDRGFFTGDVSGRRPLGHPQACSLVGGRRELAKCIIAASLRGREQRGPQTNLDGTSSRKD